jgi:transcriptional regulator with XRE-family HTH domain
MDDENENRKQSPILPNKLGLWMAYRKITPKQLADRAGTTVASISRFKNHKISMRVSTAEQIAAILGCTTTELYHRNPYDGPTLEERARDALKAVIQGQKNEAATSDARDAATTPPAATKAKRPRR